jgi:membrane fusion protein, multidrug efflux system
VKHTRRLIIRSRRAVLAPLALALIWSLSACQKAAPATNPLREVVVLPAAAESGIASVNAPAELQARFVTPMSFRVGGQVVERLVHLGDSVKKGQVVARIDPADANHNNDSAQADLASAKQHFDAAERQWQRDQQQAHENLISALQLEQTQDAFAAAQAQLKSAEARAAVAGNQSGYTRLIAEHDGVITAEQANTGEVLAAGQAVYSLAWSGALDVTAEVSENQIAQLRTGQPVVITLTALPGSTFKGQVRELSPAADPLSRTYRVKITLDSQDPALRLGMTGMVAIQPNAATKASAAIAIPATALFHDGNRPAVWIVRPGDAKIELRPVTVGVYRDRSVSLTGGVTPGEKIVVQGVHTLTNGETVRPIAPLHSEDFAL